MPSLRLDDYLVAHGFFAELKLAQAAILAGRIVDAKTGKPLDKAGLPVTARIQPQVKSPERFVGRGGEKLEGFLEQLKWNIKDRVVLDIGSSTGGFTDCLLQRGARLVHAIDVGTHQLHEKLRADPRVLVQEQTDFRDLNLQNLLPKADVVVVDVSFISLRLVVPKLLKDCPNIPWILLFKPQFEVSRYSPKRRGVADPAEADKALEEFLHFLTSLGLNSSMTSPSALRGAKGNQEFFISVEPSVPSHIFRTYDIRGVADRDLSSELVFKVGVLLGQKLRERAGVGAKMGVGRDARVSSPRLFEALTHGLVSAKVEPIELGEVTTPMTYFAHYHFNLDGVVQITASHNPKDDNGMKMMIKKETLFGEEILNLGRDVGSVTESWDESSVPSLEIKDWSQKLRSDYLEYLKTKFKFSKKYSLALDCGNGMVGAIARDAFGPVASNLQILHEEVDCRFPNHEADPTVVANFSDLKNLMKQKTFDFGFAFDGDGDRLGVMTSKGRILWGDEILMLLSELVLQERPGSTIIGEVKCSEKLFRMIKDRGGEPLMYRTGHSLIKKKMKEVGAPIAGEMSGHLFFADRYFGYDDATYAALRVMEVVDRLGLDLDSWVGKHPPSFVTPEIRVDCEESEKAGLVEGAKKFFRSLSSVKLFDIDGIRVSFEDGAWALVRASNTQAVLVVRVEAPSESRQKEVLALVEKALGRKIKVE